MKYSPTRIPKLPSSALYLSLPKRSVSELKYSFGNDGGNFFLEIFNLND